MGGSSASGAGPGAAEGTGGGAGPGAAEGTGGGAGPGAAEGADRIELKGIRARGHHGVFEHERRDGQEFVADVTIGLDLSAAGRDDDLSATVDYGVLAQQIHDVIVGPPMDLVESVALRMVDLCLSHPPVKWASVTVHKPEAPITVAFDNVSVTTERSKQ
ncbi:dihydroneopterin aldolase [Aeromicrobium sp. CTD01-1L150]|uniref:dihydroneopterin aldolase n=1 Tax=Aeromicrobium sp. CTD01-1L150 TaxID=3341830 RepID=UPI0035C0D4F5